MNLNRRSGESLGEERDKGGAATRGAALWLWIKGG